MSKRYRVTLELSEREGLEQLLSKGKADVRRLKHAQILLKADESKQGPGWSDSRIAEAVGCGTATVERRRSIDKDRMLIPSLERAIFYHTSRLYIKGELL